MAHRTPVYATTRFSKRWIGYLRRGAKAPVVDRPVKTASCRRGWYPLVDGGYVCGKYSTLDLNDPRVRNGVKAPNLDALLPYRYAYNTAHGTPLYRSLPTREQMLEYEPYLKKKANKRSVKAKSKEPVEPDPEMAEADRPSPARSKLDAGRTRAADIYADAAAASGDAAAHAAVLLDGGAVDGAIEDDTPWWQQSGDEPLEVTLADLEEQGKGPIAKRMVKGFFIAIDRTFGRNNRMWYRSTGGLMAPADRMVIPKTPELKGLEMSDEVGQVGFIRAAKARKYRFEEGKKSPVRAGRVARFTAVGLTGQTRLYKKRRYRETVEGWWMRGIDGTTTEPGPQPDGLGPDEKWIDVNLRRKSLVAFEGSRPVYAALISPGKRSEKKARDHRTKTGKFRIREKHISTTMDGDGPSGDLPYSIEDVPYVQYYDGSYALHGAFWHQNFGREQSHGCVNLAPADAKWLFAWTLPQLPRGWHGAWATQDKPGTLVVIHE